MKRIVSLILALLAALCLAGCAANASITGGSASHDDEAMPADHDGGIYYNDGAEAYENAPSSDSAANAFAAQKLIRRVELEVETSDYNAFLGGLTEQVAALGGYFESVEARTSGSRPSARLTIRVPAAQLDALTEHVNGAGNVTYRVETQQDVTLQYVDTESRIAALRTEQDRLLALLEQAQNLDEILLLEDRLSEVRYQLESYEATLRTLANQVEYATLTVNVQQVEVYTPVEQPGFWENIGAGFTASLAGVWSFFKDAFSWLIIALPYLLVFLGLPALIVLLVLRSVRRKRKNAPKTGKRAPIPQPPQPQPAEQPTAQQPGPPCV